MSFSLAEVDFLHRNRAEIDQATGQLTLSRAAALQDTQLLRERFGEYGRAVAELVAARRGAVDKLPAGWLACQESAQQATPMAVARYRAEKLRASCGAGAVIHDVTCSIGTEGHALQEHGLNYLGSDLDRARLRMAAHNLDTASGKGLIMQADALAPASTGAEVIVADPARRSGGRRITDPAKLIPPLPELLTAWTGRELAVKCAPGLDFSQWPGLVSLVSVAGAVKEACLYTPGLAGGERREAVMLSETGTDRITDADEERAGEDLAGPPGRFLIDPDGAVVRAGLVRHYAAREQLWMLDERIAYLTGDRIPVGRTGFEFIEQVPLKKLRPALVAHDCGSLEILVRGVEVDPDQLRRKLKLRGTRAMTVVCTRIGATGVALICGPRTGGATVESAS